MADHKNTFEPKPPNRLDLQKPRLALNPNGSLLSLAAKLRAAEIKVLKKMNSNPVQLENSGKFSSSIGPAGFRFSVTLNRKRKSDEIEVEDLRTKKSVAGAETGIRSSEWSLSKIDEAPLSSSNINHSMVVNCVGLYESGGTVNSSAQNVKQMTKVLENIKHWISAYQTTADKSYKRLGKMPLELSIWSLLSCTKNLGGEDAMRLIDHRNHSHAANKTKANYPAWRMSRHDLRTIEQLAVEHVIRSKSSELESRITLHLRNLKRKMAAREIPTLGKYPKTQSSSLMWTGLAQRKFRCERCTYQTDNRSHLVRHQSSIHNMFKPYHCYICTKEFTRVEYIKQHLLSVHPGVEYDATRAKNEPAVQAEQMPPKQAHHHTDRSATANRALCLDFNSSIVDGTDHYALKAINVDDRKDLLCSYCDYSSQDPDCLQQHLDKCLPSPGRYQCRLCQETFTSRCSLQVHSAQSHFTILYCCPSCPFYTVSLHTYDWHIAQQHSCERDRNLCPFCHQPFLTQNELVLHIESTHLKHTAIGREGASSRNGISQGNGQRLLFVPNGVQTVFGNDIRWQNGVGQNRV